jgi:polyhydroxyalkanoate synthase subunit PhaC
MATDTLERSAPGLTESLQSSADPRDSDRLGAVVGGGEPVGTGDPMRLLDGLADLMEPKALATESAAVATEWLRIMLGRSDVELPPKDKRFADPAWSDNFVYHRWAQAYLAWSEAVERLAATPRLKAEWKREARARFTAALVTSALAPTNLLPGNPAALKRAFDTAGLSLLRGARNALRDITTNGGMPSQVDSSSFEVGENLAATPGSVIHREEIFELIEYRPTTARVGSRPLLMIPPQVNKYYFLDLAPGRSLVEYLVGRGIHYFTIVWRNAREEHGHWGLEDYVEAQQRAVDVVRDVSGSDEVNLLGACAGGLTTALMLGHLAADGGTDGVTSATFAISMVDSRHPNGLTMMTTDRMQRSLSRDAAEGKVYDRQDLARTFAWMRPNDLVFNYVVNNWLMGNDPPAFDILAWNNDGTNLPARFDREMLDLYAHNRAAEPGSLDVLGTPIDLRRVDVDSFVIAGLTDHITPWMPCYMTSQLFRRPGEVVVTSTGHIQTMVNPPGKPRAKYFAGPEPGPDPEAWLAAADTHEGSWWPRYADWLLERSGPDREAPSKPGNRRYRPLEPAPGLYVRE